MRLNILAFAAGIIVLQMQPNCRRGLALAGGAAAATAMRWKGAFRPGSLFGVLACLALGFAWAGWRPTSGWPDALGAELEGRDVEVIGDHRDAVPQDFAARAAVSNSPLKRRLTATATFPGGSCCRVPGPARRRGSSSASRFVPASVGNDGAPETPARQRQPERFDYEAWLLERNIRDRLRPPEPAAAPDENGLAAGCTIVERLRHGRRGRRSPPCCRATAIPGPAFSWRW